ncbi:MAG: cbb3-type cytochrome oxidase assembly protein CcoS [Pseudomonadota bacterium]|nr:cbb3-type cytochrome oxidase assembly protein CcoS [Pseudomonadota bacterium]
MMMLWVLIPLSAVLLIIAGWAFFWAVDNDQLENLDEAQRQALELDDEPQEPVDK